MNSNNKPFYLKFPIFQILYILLWILIGFYLSYIFSMIVVSVSFRILELILGSIYPFAFEMFVMSGRMQAMVSGFYGIEAIIFDFIFLIVGLELITHFINKKRTEVCFDKDAIDRQD